MTEKLKGWRTGLAVAMVLVVAAIIVAADRKTLSPVITMLYAFPHGDKVGHVCLMGILAAAICLALPPAWERRGMLILAGLLLLEECSQAVLPSRTFEVADLLCSWLGVLAGGVLISWFKRR